MKGGQHKEALPTCTDSCKQAVSETATNCKEKKDSITNAKLSAIAIENIEKMKSEFSDRRKIFVSNIPVGISDKQLIDDILGFKASYQIVYSSKESGFRIIFPDTDSAKRSIPQINNSNKGRLTAQFGHPDSLLFIGNLPLSYTHSQLRTLFSTCGTILRCFIVHSVMTGDSKGYGFVEYSTRDEATITKNKMATKMVGSRSIRVDFADNGMQTVEDLQSRTIFVDRLPKGMKNESKLVDLFSTYGMVNFCQIALLPNGCPRGFAFVDMSSSEEAETIQRICNGHLIDGQEIRVSYGMPCRPGACILQPRNTHIGGPWNNKIMPGNIIGPPGYIGPLCSTAMTTIPTSVVMNNDNTIISFAGRDPCAPPIYPSNVSSSLFVPSHVQFSVSLPSFHSVPVTRVVPNANSTHDVMTITSKDIVTVNIPDSTNSEKENIPNEPEKKPITGQKRTRRPADDEDEDEDVDGHDGLMAIYDKPYIGQHDQGITFQHPLKRMKKY